MKHFDFFSKASLDELDHQLTRSPFLLYFRPTETALKQSNVKLQFKARQYEVYMMTLHSNNEL